jgi:hypothetical protein
MSEMDKMSKISKLVWHINYFSHILPYLGYIHQSAEIFQNICIKSRKEWEENLVAIIEVILWNPKFKRQIEFKNEFDQDAAKYLLVNHNYCYFTVKAFCKQESSYESLIYLLENMQIKPFNLFYELKLDSKIETFSLQQTAIAKYN